MRLIDLKCSNCGAPMKANLELKQVSCNYCGNTMLIDDEVKKMELVNGFQYGYDLERGRITAQKEQERKILLDKKNKKIPEMVVWGIVSVILIIVCIAVSSIGFKLLAGFFIVASLDRLYIVFRDYSRLNNQIFDIQTEISSYNSGTNIPRY